MSTTLKERCLVLNNLHRIGIAYDAAQDLRRISMTLRNWFELECGTGDATYTASIERDEKTGKPFKRIQFQTEAGGWASQRHPVADREKGARKRLAGLMEAFPELTYYIHTDPRGCALYIMKRSDVNGYDIEQVYNRGVAVY